MTFQLDRHRALPAGGAAPRRGGEGVRGRRRDPVPDAQRGRDRLGRRGEGPHRVPERAARGSRARSLRRPPDLQLRLAGGGLAGRDHACHPRRRPRLEHAEADPDPAGARLEIPIYAHVPSVFGEDGKKLSKRHGAVSVDEFRAAGYIAPALMNFLALLGWAPDGETTIMSTRRADRALLARARRREPGDVRLREARLDERRLPTGAAAGGVRRGAAARTCASRATTGTSSGCARPCRSCRRRSRSSASSPTSRASSSTTSSPTRPCSTRMCSPPQPRRSSASSRSRPSGSRARSKELCDELGLKPRQAFQPIRVAVTGSKVSPGLYESLELLGREESLARISARRRGGGLSGASGSSARWNSAQARRR